MKKDFKDILEVHNCLMDLLNKGDMYTIEGIVNKLNNKYGIDITVNAIEKIVKDYVKEGILIKHKDEGTYYYYVSYLNVAELVQEIEGLDDAISFYSNDKIFGTMGNCIKKRIKAADKNAFVYANNGVIYNDEKIKKLANDNHLNMDLTQILFNIIDTIKKENQIEIVNIKSKNCVTITPIKIYVSATDNIWIIGEDAVDCKIKGFNLNEYSFTKVLKNDVEHMEIIDKFNENEKYWWGIECINNSQENINKLRVILNIEEYYEQRIIDKINREKRNAEFERIGNNIYSLTMELYNCKEAMEWIRTFTGRIVMIECDDKSIVRSVYNDIENMYKLYNS